MDHLGRPIAVDAQLYTSLELFHAFDWTFKEHLDGGVASSILQSPTIFTNGLWYPIIGRTFDVGDVINQPTWLCFVREDARESMRLLRFAFLANVVHGQLVCLLLLVI
ncbi:unnamed protein product [Ilex paraguariensis]|uniref:Uncharacterized protein n=1 Tax=Ilex paraguariensis TaxID=185542 RepID=A0ABC8U0I0_9AQUA